MGRSALATAVAALSLAAAAPAAAAADAPTRTTTTTISVKLSHATIKRGQTARLTGTVSLARPGTFVELQRRRGRTWRDQGSAELRLSNRFSFTIRARAKGKLSYRVTIKGSRTASETVTLTVT